MKTTSENPLPPKLQPSEVHDEKGVGSAATCSALGLAVEAWNRKAPREELRLEIAAIIHGDSVAELADNLEYIAVRLRETGWTAGSGGGKHSKLVWEMFCKPNAGSDLPPPSRPEPTKDVTGG